MVYNHSKNNNNNNKRKKERTKKWFIEKNDEILQGSIGKVLSDLVFTNEKRRRRRRGTISKP